MIIDSFNISSKVNCTQEHLLVPNYINQMTFGVIIVVIETKIERIANKL